MAENQYSKVAKENYALWKRYKDARRNWMVDHVDEATKFYFGAHWTDEERKILKERGQADIVINRVRAIIRFMVALLTANKPSFRAVPVTGGDRKVANIFNEIFSYIWRISKGYKQFERAIFNYTRAGLGWFLVYLDPEANWGQGEVKIRQVPLRHVYVDPSAGEEPDWSDAEAIIISKRIPLKKAQELYPKAKKRLRRAVMSAEAEDSDLEQEDEIIFGSEEVADTDVELEGGQVRIIEAYRKRAKTFWLVLDKTTGQTTVSKSAPKEEETIQSAPVRMPYIERTVSAGYDVFIAREDLPPPIEDYPLIPVIYEDTENTQPIGEVEFLKGPQKFLNKAMSVTILSAQVGSTPKVLLPAGSVDNIENFQDAYAAPGAVLEVRMDANPPIIVQPIPLNNAFFSIAETMKRDMEYESGAFGPLQGDPSDAPQTAKATLALQEYGASKSKLSLRSVESALTRLGQSTMQFVQAYWKQPKILRLVTDETEQEQEIAVNQPVLDDQGQEIERLNDVTVGKYDIAVTMGSTLPTNRMLLYGLHMELVEKGVPLKYALKYLDVPDAEKIIAETDTVKQQQAQMEQMEQGIEQMQNELQKANTKVETADRAVRDAQYSANWSKALNQFRADLETERSRFRENLRGEIAETVRDTLAEFNESQAPKKG